MKNAKLTLHWLIWLLVMAMTVTSVYSGYAQSSKSEPQRAETSSKKFEGKPLLQDALRLYEELEWDQAIKKFKEALAAGLDAASKAEAYWHLAVIARANGDLQASENYIKEALKAKPSFTLPESAQGTDLEPIFKAALARTDRTPPEVRILPPKAVHRNKSIVIVAEVSDKSPVEQVELSFLLPDAQGETVVAMKPEKANRWRGEIPTDATKTPGELKYTVSAQDEWQNLETQSGTVVISLKEGGRGMLYLLGGTVVGIGGGFVAWLLSQGEEEEKIEVPSWPKSSSPSPPQLE